MAEKKLTRAERSELNRAAHARKRAALERQWARQEAEKRAAREERRERNRAAWWAMAYGVVAPGQGAEPDELPACNASHIERVDSGAWQVIGKDGAGYEVTRSYRVSLDDGSAYDVPALSDAAELIAMAVDTNREASAAVASFRDGQSLTVGAVTYRIEHVTSQSVKVTAETPAGPKATVCKLRHSSRGQWIRLHPNSRAQRDIYAADLAA